jgi:hypothetical protein
MARDLQTIYNELTASKESNSDLDTLLPNPDNWATLYTYENFKLLANTVLKALSDSKVAIWRLTMNVVAYCIWSQEKLYDIFVDEVDTKIENREFGQLQWYVEKSKEFQEGYELEWVDNKKYAYTTVDEEAQIVTQAAAIVTNGVILIKVAKGDIGSLEKLDTGELNAFIQYMKGTNQPFVTAAIAPAGTALDVLSENPDELRFAAQVFYNSQVLDENGESLIDGTKPVETAVTNYIQQIPFDSKFRVSGLIDAIQAVNGVRNVVVSNCDAKTSGQTWGEATNVITETGKQYIARAGYLKMGDDYPLDGFYDSPTNLVRTLTYIKDE